MTTTSWDTATVITASIGEASIALPLPSRFTLIVGKFGAGIPRLLQGLRFRSDYAFRTMPYFGAEWHPEEIFEGVGRERSLLATREPHVVNVYWTVHPYVVDCFKPTDVVAIAKCPEGTIRAKVLTEHPDYEKWRFGYQTGEWWATVGEDWVSA